jgi:5-bromo-4-chloroindolyl phosphate hydrolysis protein
VNKAKRYAAYATLHANNVHMAVGLHELWRVTNTEKDGLTDKEYAYLSKQYDELEQTLLKISKATRHVKQGL